MSKLDAQKKINNLAKDSSLVFITEKGHAEERMDQRDFTRSDIIDILREGIIIEDPSWRKNDWCYKVQIKGFRGRIGAAVVTVIYENSKLFVVTVMWLDKR